MDTLNVPAPVFSPNGGNFHMNVAVRMSANVVPTGAMIEYTVDNGTTWITGQQLNLTKGAKIFARLRSGKKVSPVSSAQFSVFYERMLIIGNSTMMHKPDPTRGWLNTNGMAASAPEKDFVHLLAARLQALNPAMTYLLQSGGDFERYYSTSGYSSQELSQTLQQFKPDLIVLRIGENVDQAEVLSRNFDKYYRELLDLLNYGQPVRIVCTTSVWWQNRSDPIVRKVVTEKGYSLVDLDCIVGQTQYFATQYKDKGVAEHPNDAGMQVIANMIWSKIQGLAESGCP
ncbi:SGNH/GDSL hydrolase family protein [Spirosoma sp. BT702]|uniref:SGNH/GDSL hydrolase family protein n=1 Tax=Spirosoma profusum TaxID=2771354 RepID=A0A926XTT8_9BACT|nr:SGNH/GDSL hydrolase family protein [Spirosoma profusum]